MTEKRVVGVSYKPGDAAPMVVLKGAGESADALLGKGREQPQTKVVKNATLVDQLYKVPVDSPVDKALFPIMATLLIHVLTIDEQNKEAST